MPIWHTMIYERYYMSKIIKITSLLTFCLIWFNSSEGIFIVTISFCSHLGVYVHTYFIFCMLLITAN